MALLAFKLGPVQSFIEASRSLRDLLAGSYILSWIAFEAMKPILESCGPTAFVYPALRHVPLMDDWLCNQGVPLVPKPKLDQLACPSLPHRFLAIVPSAQQQDLKSRTVEAARSAWLSLASAVREHIQEKHGSDYAGWDLLWDRQVESYFDFRATSYSMADLRAEQLFPAERIERFKPLSDLAEGYAERSRPGQWQLAVEASAMLMDAQNTVRHIPVYRAESPAGPKCTLFGTYEQVGPAILADSDRLWRKMNGDDKAGDRRCAIGMVKRFAFDAYFKPLLGLREVDTRFDSTRDFCNLSGQKRPYYAVLMMDGDEMGKWLSGEKSPKVEEVLHEKLVRYHKKSKERSAALALPRPVSPALHNAISAALNTFSTKLAPEIVDEHNGQLIYAGGDDVLAVLPLDTALTCAKELREAFSSEEAMGERATVSAGLVIAHEKEDLRYVLQCARAAEKLAKDSGRNRLVLGILRRSGEHAFNQMAWDYTSNLEIQRAAFSGDITDRWAYKLRGELPMLQALPSEAWGEELKRMLAHGEGGMQQLGRFQSDWEAYASLECPKGNPGIEVFVRFVLLCQSASFLARGGDRA